MGFDSEQRISGVKVLNIIEENAEAVEKMVNQAIAELNENKVKILDVHVTGDNLILILGDKNS